MLLVLVNELVHFLDGGDDEFHLVLLVAHVLNFGHDAHQGLCAVGLSVDHHELVLDGLVLGLQG